MPRLAAAWCQIGMSQPRNEAAYTYTVDLGQTTLAPTRLHIKLQQLDRGSQSLMVVLTYKPTLAPATHPESEEHEPGEKLSMVTGQRCDNPRAACPRAGMAGAGGCRL